MKTATEMIHGSVRLMPEPDPVPTAVASANSGIVPQIVSAVHACPDCSHRVANALEGIYATLVRLADHLAPDPDKIVGTEYVAAKLGCTPTHVARLARDGEIPPSCVVPGCGDGKPWKFVRVKIDNWLAAR